MFNFFKRKKQEPKPLVKGQAPQRKPVDQRKYSSNVISGSANYSSGNWGTSLPDFSTDERSFPSLANDTVTSNDYGGGDFGGAGAGSSWDNSSSESSSSNDSYDSGSDSSSSDSSCSSSD